MSLVGHGWMAARRGAGALATRNIMHGWPAPTRDAERGGTCFVAARAVHGSRDHRRITPMGCRRGAGNGCSQIHDGSALHTLAASLEPRCDGVSTSRRWKQRSHARCGGSAVPHDIVAPSVPGGCARRERFGLFDVFAMFGYTARHRRSGGMADATVSKTVEGDLVWVRLPPSAPRYRQSVRLVGIGAWLSLVERSVRVAEVGGSNPLAPTNTGVTSRFAGGPSFIARAHAACRRARRSALSSTQQRDERA